MGQCLPSYYFFGHTFKTVNTSMLKFSEFYHLASPLILRPFWTRLQIIGSHRKLRLTGVPNFGMLNLVKNCHFSSSKSNISTSTLWNWLKFSEYLDYLIMFLKISIGAFLELSFRSYEFSAMLSAFRNELSKPHCKCKNSTNIVKNQFFCKKLIWISKYTL